MSEKAGDSRYRYYMSHVQLAPVSSHLAQMHRLQMLNFEMQRELLEKLDHAGMLTATEREQMRAEIGSILELQA